MRSAAVGSAGVCGGFGVLGCRLPLHLRIWTTPRGATARRRQKTVAFAWASAGRCSYSCSCGTALPHWIAWGAALPRGLLGDCPGLPALRLAGGASQAVGRTGAAVGGAIYERVRSEPVQPQAHSTAHLPNRTIEMHDLDVSQVVALCLTGFSEVRGREAHAYNYVGSVKPS